MEQVSTQGSHPDWLQSKQGGQKCVLVLQKHCHALLHGDMILIDPDDKPIDNIIKELCNINYDLTDESDLEDYLGIRIK